MSIPRRVLGKTGEKVSILAVGGFHLIEALPKDVDNMLSKYLDAGGNFIETAISYGDSEAKIGRTMKIRRNECFLSTKTLARDANGITESINASLKNLQTDYVDNLFMHNVFVPSDLEELLNSGLEAAEKAKEAGKIRHISISTHNPYLCLEALRKYKFDAVMAWINFYDKCNYPVIFRDLINYCNEIGTGIVAMKPLADGYLYKNSKDAIRWALSQPISAISSGMNSMKMLETNLATVKDFEPMSKAEELILLKNSKELGNYVCRQCASCSVSNDLGLELKRIFEIEGHYDRQMYDGTVPDNADYALRERLRFWFGNQDMAKEFYNDLEVKVPENISSKNLSGECHYSIDVEKKLRIAAWKLTGNNSFIS